MYNVNKHFRKTVVFYLTLSSVICNIKFIKYSKKTALKWKEKTKGEMFKKY